ncbi:MAG: HAMP domain-containing protein [Proteobacteria bacterium]|nr:HAMP domain-containing protein [Pseudomonadota bacterium]MBU1687411.1 HAMP domain-containing protein [Pseudomonadota bacterium]
MKLTLSLTKKYLLLSLAILLFIFGLVFSSFVLTENIKGESQKINLASRQHLQLMRISSLVHFFVNPSPLKVGMSGPDSVQKIQKEAQVYETVLYGLKDGDPALGLTPIALHDPDSLVQLDLVIKHWNKSQKPILQKILITPVSERQELCNPCHSAFREHINEIELLASTMSNNYNQHLKSFSRFRFFALLFFPILLLGITWFIRRKLILPVKKLKEATDLIEQGDFEVRLPVLSSDEIGYLTMSHNRMAEKLKLLFQEKEDNLNQLTFFNQEILARESDLKSSIQNQGIVNAILQISLSPISLVNQLQLALPVILSIGRVELLSSGVIFLASENADELQMAAFHGIGKTKAAACRRVPFGVCHCGRAAAKGEIQFASCVDHKHEIDCFERDPHGHYCVPIISGNKLLGVICVYVEEGHERKAEEEEILLTITNILAGIIERKKMEEQLVQLVHDLQLSIKNLDDEKIFTESVIRSLSTGLMVLDLEGRIIAANPNGDLILNQFEPEPIGKELVSVLGDSAVQAMTGIHDEVSHVSAEITLPSRKGTERTLGFTATNRKDAVGNRVGIIISFNDITEDKYFRKEIENMNRLSTVAEIASAVAHEVRNPLAGIKTMAQAIDEHLSENDDKKEYIIRIIRQIDRLNILLTNFFSYARPAEPKKVQTSLQDIISETKPLISSRLYKKGIKLKEQYEEDLPLVNVDPNQIQQVFLNLMLNSIEAFKQSGVIEIIAEKFDATKKEIYSLTYPELKDSSNYVLVHFRDTGPGLDDTIAEKIFEPFFTTKHTGSGLGLSIVYRILKENNAIIHLDRSVKEGTAFMMIFETGK